MVSQRLTIKRFFFFALACLLLFLLRKNKRRKDTKIVFRHPVGVKETMVRKRKEGLQSSAFFFALACLCFAQDCFPSPRRGERNHGKTKTYNQALFFSRLHACCCFYYVKTKEEKIPRLFPFTP